MFSTNRSRGIEFKVSRRIAVFCFSFLADRQQQTRTEEKMFFQPFGIISRSKEYFGSPSTNEEIEFGGLGVGTLAFYFSFFLLLLPVSLVIVSQAGDVKMYLGEFKCIRTLHHT